MIDGRDVLLVMPTGSGKSLCYQLPGIARGGTTLVISPLIALMEDQVAKLQERGFAVERIHSGRDRAASRQACIDYLNGNLQFLFIAPERLRVPGFPEMLAKRKPSLIAIDEAHCISQWGHDFRPDYRMLGQYLPTLRPAPVIALTATATPIVQNDIATQLGLRRRRVSFTDSGATTSRSKWWRCRRRARPTLARELLDHDERRPAIVYTPTRAQAESAGARTRTRTSPAAPYHAGLDAERRERVQEDFLDGRLEVIVATIAFGMGIDKPNIRTVIHTALPGSVEAYYQEIGRAGRDGAPSRAILMHSYADRRTHDFFFERDYPDVSVLEHIFRALPSEPQPKDAVQARVRMTGDDFDIALEKLWIHGGAIVDYADNISRGIPDFAEFYLAQRQHKVEQFEKVLPYCESACCRMLALVRYFGDTADSRCVRSMRLLRSGAAIAQTFRPATAAERAHIRMIAEALNGADGSQRSFVPAGFPFWPTGPAWI